jgi:hypothetical protein
MEVVFQLGGNRPPIYTPTKKKVSFFFIAKQQMTTKKKKIKSGAYLRQKRKCNRMFRHNGRGRCIQASSRLARKLYPLQKDLVKALKKWKCRGVVHQTPTRFRCIDVKARRNKKKYEKKKKTKKTKKSKKSKKSKSKSY